MKLSGARCPKPVLGSAGVSFPLPFGRPTPELTPGSRLTADHGRGLRGFGPVDAARPPLGPAGGPSNVDGPGLVRGIERPGRRGRAEKRGRAGAWVNGRRGETVSGQGGGDDRSEQAALGGPRRSSATPSARRSRLERGPQPTTQPWRGIAGPCRATGRAAGMGVPWEGAVEDQSERTSRSVSEDRRRQRRQGASGPAVSRCRGALR